MLNAKQHDLKKKVNFVKCEEEEEEEDINENNSFTLDGKQYIENLIKFITTHYNKQNASYRLEEYINYVLLVNTEIDYGLKNNIYNELDLETIMKKNQNYKQLFKILRNLRIKFHNNKIL